MIKKSKKVIVAGLASTLTVAYMFGSFAQAKDTTEKTHAPSTAKEKLTQLKEDKQWYDKCSQTAKEQYQRYYHELKFKI